MINIEYIDQKLTGVDISRLEPVYDEVAQTYWALPKWTDQLQVKPGEPDYTHFVAHGGRNFGHKSESAHLCAVLLAQEQPLNVLCLRHQQNALSDSAIATVWAWMNHKHNDGIPKETVIDEFGDFQRQVFWTLKGNRIEGANGSVFMFRGCSTSRGTDESLRSIKNVHLVIVDEAQLLQQDAFDVAIPSFLRSPKIAFAGGIGTKVWYLMNPETAQDPCWQLVEQAAKSKGKIRVAKMTIKDSPFMPQELKDEMERDRIHNPVLWAWKWGGNFKPQEGDFPSLLRRTEIELIYQYSKDHWQTIKEELLDTEVEAGADIARSATGDSFSYCMRQGPIITGLWEWKGHDFNDSWARIKRVSRYIPDCLYYDQTGVGAGFVDTRRGDFYVDCVGETFGGAVQGENVIYDGDVTNGEHFANRGAQMYFSYKIRAENTLKLIKNDEDDLPPLNACLFFHPSIDPKVVGTLADQSAIAEYQELNDRKIKVNKKRKGFPSPDVLDSVALAFASDSEDGLDNSLSDGMDYDIYYELESTAGIGELAPMY